MCCARAEDRSYSQGRRASREHRLIDASGQQQGIPLREPGFQDLLRRGGKGESLALSPSTPNLVYLKLRPLNYKYILSLRGATANTLTMEAGWNSISSAKCELVLLHPPRVLISAGSSRYCLRQPVLVDERDYKSLFWR